MFSFFRTQPSNELSKYPTTNQKSAPSTSQLRKNGSSYTLKTLLVVLGASLIETINADKCLGKTNGGFYKLNGAYENEAMSAINTNCNFEMSDCNKLDRATDMTLEFFSSFVTTTSNFFYGNGYFGGHSCHIVYKTSNFDPQPFNKCVEQALKYSCKDGYGTTVDYLATAGIVFGGLLVLTCIGGIISGCREQMQEKPAANARQARRNRQNRQRDIEEGNDEQSAIALVPPTVSISDVLPINTINPANRENESENTPDDATSKLSPRR